MSSFKKLNTKKYQKSSSIVSQDAVYWKQFKIPILVKEFGPIDFINFSPVEPYYFAVTCSVRVQVYNPITKLVAKNLSRFRESAYGAVFRSDGRLLCAGDEEANVKLFDVSTKNLLRLFRGHGAPVHRTYFVEGKPQIASFSDDKSVKIWDIATEANILTFSEHSDYVRAGATSAAVPDVILSGGYDNYVKMYDTRTNQTVLNLDHGSPVESLIFLPSGGLFLSAGGTEIKIWDTIAGGKLLGSISQHHKTITCLSLASNNKRLLSGSLDRHVKVYDVSSFKVVHTFDYPNAILSMGVSKNDDTLAVGLVDGVIAISRRDEIEKKQKEKKKVAFQHATHSQKPLVDVVVLETKHVKETKHDKCLRKFEYSKALNCALIPYVANKRPEVTVSVIQELIKRRALQKAFLTKDKKGIMQILQFFIRHISEDRFAKVLNDATNIFIDCFIESPLINNPEVKRMLVNLIQLLKKEVEIGNEFMKLQGIMHMILSAATVQTKMRDELSLHHNLTPSADAQKNLIVNLT